MPLPHDSEGSDRAVQALKKNTAKLMEDQNEGSKQRHFFFL